MDNNNTIANEQDNLKDNSSNRIFKRAMEEIKQCIFELAYQIQSGERLSFVMRILLILIETVQILQF